MHVLEIQAARTLSDPAWSEPCSGAVGGARVKGSAWSSCQYLGIVVGFTASANPRMQCHISPCRWLGMGSRGDGRTSRCQRRLSRPVNCSVGALRSSLHSYLCATVSWEGVVPKTLVWSLNWCLVVLSVSESAAGTCQCCQSAENHACDSS